MPDGRFDGIMVGIYFEMIDKMKKESHLMAFCMGTSKKLATKKDPASVSLVYSMPPCVVYKILQGIILSPHLSCHAGLGLKKLYGCMEAAAL